MLEKRKVLEKGIEKTDEVLRFVVFYDRRR